MLLMNANNDTTYTHLKSFLANTALKYVVKHHASKIVEQNIHLYVQNNVDVIAVSEDLLELSEGAGHISFWDPFIKDHRGVYWDKSRSTF